jgi:Na+/proline symporter
LSFAYVVITYFGTWVGGGTIIGLVGLSYLSGLSKYWILCIPYLMGFLFSLLFITRIRKLQQYCIGDMMALRYPNYHQVIRIPTAIAVIIRNITMIGMQFSAISLLVAYVFHINRNLAILIIFCIITAYTALSGLWGIVGTDILQGILQVFGLIVLLTQSMKLSGGWDYATHYFITANHADYIRLFNGVNWWEQIGVYFTTFGLFFLIGDQGDWQKINSCKSDKIAFWGYLTPVCVGMIWLMIPAYVGIFQRVIMPKNVSADVAIFQMILENFSKIVGSFVIVCLLAAVKPHKLLYSF